MCFSATASLTAGSLLLISGAYTTYWAQQSAPKYVPLAAYPLAFGIQQLMEGGVWIGLNQEATQVMHTFALGFLGFSHGFWLFWVPFSIFWLEERPLYKRFLGSLTVLGCLFGATLYLPLWFNDWMQVSATHGHMTYDVRLIYGGLIPWSLGRSLYAAIVLLPFLLAPKPSIHLLGLLMLTSMLVTVWLYEAIAFISVWCFFAAIISLYILYVLREQASLSLPEVETSSPT